MKVLEINSVPYGSTCRIMLGIAEVARKHGIEVHTATGYSTHPISGLKRDYIPIGGIVGKYFHTQAARLTGWNGFFSLSATWRLIRRIKHEKYDVIHLHNVHGWYLNFPLFFGLLKREQIKVLWTLHDCWTFTGQCPYFTMVGCNRWQTGCYDCPQCDSYPKTWVDRSKELYNCKKRWFTGLNATLITPSRWLAGLVQQSFLKDYPVRVINNGIDLTVFSPTSSDFKKRHHCASKFVVLGVALGWGRRKGLDVFIELSKRLDERFQIVLVGTDDDADKQLPVNVISIHCTQDQRELAAIYSAASVFANPTREDNFPTVNLEALACGTPIVTFQTGGSPEIVTEDTGSVVLCDDVDAMEKEIIRVCTTQPYSVQACVNRASEFNMLDRFEEYTQMYGQMMRADTK